MTLEDLQAMFPQYKVKETKRNRYFEEFKGEPGFIIHNGKKGVNISVASATDNPNVMREIVENYLTSAETTNK